MDDFWSNDHVPWDGPGEWVAWLALLIIATFLIHNGLNAYKKAK